MKLVIVKALALILALLTLISLFAACADTGSETENETESKNDFDYLGADMSKYITIAPNDYQSNTVTLGTEFLIDDALVQKYIDDERFQNRKKENGGELYTDRPIRHADSAFIYYTGYIDGEKFEGGSNATDKYSYELVIGSGSFIPGFEDQLIGVIPDDTSMNDPHIINVTFPEDYGHVDLAGKKAVFEVWVEYTIQYSVPEFTDEYVAKTLKFNGSTEDYRAEVKKKLEDASRDEAESQAVDAIINKLIEKVTVIEYPESSVNYWYNQYMNQFEYYKSYYEYYGLTFASMDEFIIEYLGLEKGADCKKAVTDLAKDVVRNNLIYYAIAEQQDLSVSEQEYKDGVKALAEYYSEYYTNYYGYEIKYTEEDIIKEVGETQLKQNILFDKVEDYLIEHCTIEYKDVESK